MKQRSNVRGDFAQIDCYEDANWQIRKARELIEFIAPNPGVRKGSALFAYPFGHVGGYLHDEYFPEFLHEHGTIAAFTTQPALIHSETSVYAIPRFVLGESWNSPQDLGWLR